MAAAVIALTAVTPAWPQHHAPAGSGTVGLDVYAQGAVVDLLVAEKAAPGTTLQHRRSRDGGRTWGDPVTVPLGKAGLHPPHRGAEPQIAAHGAHVLVLWTEPGTSSFGSGPLGTAISDDGGRTWTAGGNPADDGGTGGHGYADVTADAAGRFHAVWLDSRDGGQGLRAARSSDGRTWSRNATLDARTCGAAGTSWPRSAATACACSTATRTRATWPWPAATTPGRGWARLGRSRWSPQRAAASRPSGPKRRAKARRAGVPSRC
jgi:hypothetical protein